MAELASQYLAPVKPASEQRSSLSRGLGEIPTQEGMLQCKDNCHVQGCRHSRKLFHRTAICGAPRVRLVYGQAQLEWGEKWGWRTSVGEFEMLSKRRCPHTGVVNFFFAADPHLAVGSIVKVEGTGYLWRCYTDPCAAVGSEADMKTAEQRVAELCRKAAAHNDDTQAFHAA